MSEEQAADGARDATPPDGLIRRSSDHDGNETGSLQQLILVSCNQRVRHNPAMRVPPED
jgi:hypothetical protein